MQAGVALGTALRFRKMAWLHVLAPATLHGADARPDAKGFWVELGAFALRAGRAPPGPDDPSCVLQLHGQHAGRRHFIIEPAARGGWQLRDLNSAGGTWVNRVRAALPRQLADGDVISLNQTVAVFKNDCGGEPVEGPPPQR